MFDLIIQQEIFCWDIWLPLSRFKKKIEKKKASYCIDSECLLFNYGLLFLFHLDSTFQSSKQVPNLKMFKNEPSQPNKGCIQQKSSPNRTPAWDLDPPPLAFSPLAISPDLAWPSKARPGEAETGPGSGGFEDVWKCHPVVRVCSTNICHALSSPKVWRKVPKVRHWLS